MEQSLKADEQLLQRGNNDQAGDQDACSVGQCIEYAGVATKTGDSLHQFRRDTEYQHGQWNKNFETPATCDDQKPGGECSVGDKVQNLVDLGNGNVVELNWGECRDQQCGGQVQAYDLPKTPVLQGLAFSWRLFLGGGCP